MSPVVLYGHEKWSLRQREEHRLRVSENRVLRGTFGPTREDGAGGWRRLHNEELHNLSTSPNIIRVMKSRTTKLTGHAAHNGDTRNAHKILVEKTEGNKLFGTLRRKKVKLSLCFF
jgi:hypothetical protein